MLCEERDTSLGYLRPARDRIPPKEEDTLIGPRGGRQVSSHGIIHSFAFAISNGGISYSWIELRTTQKRDRSANPLKNEPRRIGLLQVQKWLQLTPNGHRLREHSYSQEHLPLPRHTRLSDGSM